MTTMPLHQNNDWGQCTTYQRHQAALSHWTAQTTTHFYRWLRTFVPGNDRARVDREIHALFREPYKLYGSTRISRQGKPSSWPERAAIGRRLAEGHDPNWAALKKLSGLYQNRLEISHRGAATDDFYGNNG